jgi:type VI secretion system secreted protein VgrG
MKSKCLIISVVAAVAVCSSPSRAGTILNSADGFAVLGGSTVTSTGNTILNGDLGVYPGTAITGFAPGIVHGVTYPGGAVAQQAERDALSAYNLLAGEAFTQSLTGQDLGGLTLTPGVYKFNTSALLTGMLTLDAQNDPDGIFVFQIGSTLTTAGSASINLLNGAQAGNVFWQVGSSATLGSDTSFDGSILAAQSITLNTDTSLSGRALALNAAVTLDNNVITVPLAVPEPAAFSLLVFCAGLFGMGQSFRAAAQNRSFLKMPVARCGQPRQP